MEWGEIYGFFAMMEVARWWASNQVAVNAQRQATNVSRIPGIQRKGGAGISPNGLLIGAHAGGG